MGPILPLIALSLIHVTIVLLAATKPGGTEPILIFADVFDPAQSQLDGMVRLFEVRDFVAEEWPHGACANNLAGPSAYGRSTSHDPSLRVTSYGAAPAVLIWDLFVGRAIWLDSLERGTPFTWASLLLTNGIGPPGMLLYVLLCLGSGRGLPTLGYQPQEE